MKLPKKITDIFKKTGKGAGEVAPKGTALGKAGKIAGYGGAAGLAIEGIDALTKKLQNDALNNPDKDIQVASEQDNEPIVPGGSVLPSNVIPFRVNRSLKTYNNLVPDNVPDSVKIDILEKRVGELTEKVDRFEKVEAEREQALAFQRQEDKIEQKIQKVESDHVSGKTKKVIQNVAKDVMGPAILAMLMSMGALKGFIADTTEKVEGLNTDITDILQKLALASIPGFAIADLAKRKLGPVTPLGNPPKTAAPEPPKSRPPGSAPESANDNKIGKIREKLTKLKAPKWLFDVLDRVGKLAKITSSRIPFIGAMITIILETIDSYNPDLHKDPAEFQKLLIKSIVVGLGQSLAFGAIIVLFTMIGGPLGTLAGIIVYVLAEDKINDTIREELIGYLVKYVLFDEDPLEAAKKSGRYKTYETLKKDAEDKLNLAKGNLAVIEGKEARGEKLTPHEQSMKEGFKAQIQGYEKRGQMLKDAQKEIEVQGQKQKEYVEAGRAKERGENKELTGIEALKQEIASGEGDYNAFNKGRAGDSINSKEFDITNMTVDEVLQAQKTKGLFAVGKYQFIPKTLEESVKYTGVDGSAKFNAETQEKLFSYLISDKKRHNLAAYLEGKHDNVDKALDDLAYEFASIPDSSGRGKYDGDSAGNRASGSVNRANKIKTMLQDIREKNRLNKNIPVSTSPEPVTSKDFLNVNSQENVNKEFIQSTAKPAEPVASTDKKIDLIPNVPVAPKAPPVVVFNETPPPPQISSRIEKSELPSPGEIPNPIAGNRPDLNVSYSPY